MKIRYANPDTHRQIAELFTNTIRRVAIKDYSCEQLDAWAPQPIPYRKWETWVEQKNPIVVENGNEILAFANLEENGHIDCFYVHHCCVRHGIGTILLERLEMIACDMNLNQIFGEASITALPFFLRHNFAVIEEQHVQRNGIILKNYRIAKEKWKIDHCSQLSEERDDEELFDIAAHR